ncbi:hypothetical protein V1511DRAFT_371103 [Dipodascopsis uninucleata]
MNTVNTINISKSEQIELKCGPRVLREVYPIVIRLDSLLSKILPVSLKVLKEDDPDDYKRMITTIFVGTDTGNVLCNAHGQFNVIQPGPTRYKMKEIVDRIIQGSFDVRAKERRNILSLGFKDTGEGTTIGNNVIQEHFSSNYHETCKTRWQILLNRIGDEIMFYILKYTSFFQLLQNGCVNQITGIPIQCVRLTKGHNEGQIGNILLNSITLSLHAAMFYTRNTRYRAATLSLTDLCKLV